MPGFMFQDVVSPRTGSARKWYTVPLSFLVHTLALAVLVVIPLLATDLPRPREVLQYVTPYVPVIPAAPPPSRRVAPQPPARGAVGAPLVAATTIGVEPGVIFQPGDVDTTGIESIVGGIDAGPAVVEALPPAAPAPPGPVVVGGNIKPPARIKYVAPAYPAIARNAGVSGIVIIEAVIGVDGKVDQAQGLRAPPLLAEAALSAVREWEYTPTLLNGRPTAVIMTVTVNFTLKH
jgi:protein TonB